MTANCSRWFVGVLGYVRSLLEDNVLIICSLLGTVNRVLACSVYVGSNSEQYFEISSSKGRYHNILCHYIRLKDIYLIMTALMFTINTNEVSHESRISVYKWDNTD